MPIDYTPSMRDLTGPWFELIDQQHRDLAELIAAHQACPLLREASIASQVITNQLLYAMHQPDFDQ